MAAHSLTPLYFCLPQRLLIIGSFTTSSVRLSLSLPTCFTNPQCRLSSCMRTDSTDSWPISVSPELYMFLFFLVLFSSWFLLLIQCDRLSLTILPAFKCVLNVQCHIESYSQSQIHTVRFMTTRVIRNISARSSRRTSTSNGAKDLLRMTSFNSNSPSVITMT